MDIELLKSFFLWCTVINVGLLILSFVIMLTAKKKVYAIHGKWFKLTDEQFDAIWYSFLAGYKILVFVLNVVPYIALTIIS